MGSGKEDMMGRLMLALYCSDVKQRHFSEKNAGILLYYHLSSIIRDSDCPTVQCKCKVCKIPRSMLYCNTALSFSLAMAGKSKLNSGAMMLMSEVGGGCLFTLDVELR